MLKVLVTGANGLLGSAIVRQLNEAGHAVKTLLLPGSNLLPLEDLNYEPIYGNILDPASVKNALAGCQAVIHVAADTSVWPNRSERIRRINIEGTANMVKAAREAQIQRFVHVGSASSFGYGTKTTPGNETSPYEGHRYGMEYLDSKYEGQQLVLRAAREEGFPALVVAPTFMFGPRDAKPGSGAMILAVYNQQLPAYAPGGKNYVAAQDVATAAVNGLTMGRIGECYIAGHANLNYQEATALIADTLEVPAPRFGAPAWALKGIGMFSNLFARLSGKPPKISYAMARIACDEHYFSPAKAIEELQMPQTDLRFAVREAFNWFQDNGYVDQ